MHLVEPGASSRRALALLFGLLLLLGAAGLAQAGVRSAGDSLLRAKFASHVARNCPPGVPAQEVTVVNQARVRSLALARVERATTDQSMQLRAAWGTPCVRFGPGGWVLTLTTGTPIQNDDGSTSYTTSGRHCGALGTTRGTCYSAQPTLFVETAGLSYAIWARALTHEMGEALVDPTDGVRWQHGLVEICDLVENLTYLLDGVPVSDFVFPSYFSGTSGPWDQMGVLTGP